MYLLWPACWGWSWLVWWGIHCWIQCTVLLWSKLTGQSLASNSRILQIIRLPGGMTQCLPTPSREIDPITYEKLFSSATAGLVANFGTFCWWIQSRTITCQQTTTYLRKPKHFFCFFFVPVFFWRGLNFKGHSLRPLFALTLRYWLTYTRTVKTVQVG